MNATIKAAIVIPQSYCSLLRIAFFHFTPVLERKRSSSNSNNIFSTISQSNYAHKKQSKKFLKEHEEKIRRALEEIKRAQEEKTKRAEEEAKRLKEEASKAKETKENQNDKHDFPNSRKGHFDYREFNYILRTLFGRGFTCSFTIEEEDRRWWRHSFTLEKENGRWWRHSSWDFNNSSRSSWRSQYRKEKKEEEEENGNTSKNSRDYVIDSVQASHRKTLGLSPSGPLILEDIKHAYRTSALKWHPDRHDHSTKAAAEEKFKLCTVAYQYLIEKLPLN